MTDGGGHEFLNSAEGILLQEKVGQHVLELFVKGISTAF